MFNREWQRCDAVFSTMRRIIFNNAWRPCVIKFDAVYSKMCDNNVNAVCLTIRDKFVTQYVQQCVETMRRSMFNNVTNYIQQCVATM